MPAIRGRGHCFVLKHIFLFNYECHILVVAQAVVALCGPHNVLPSLLAFSNDSALVSLNFQHKGDM